MSETQHAAPKKICPYKLAYGGYVITRRIGEEVGKSWPFAWEVMNIRHHSVVGYWQSFNDCITIIDNLNKNKEIARNATYQR